MIRRGEVWWAALAERAGSEPGHRPGRWSSFNATNFNESRIRTVVVVALTTNLRLAAAPGNVLCRKMETGLPKESVINVSQVFAINKIRLTHRAGKLSAGLMQTVEAGLRSVLGL